MSACDFCDAVTHTVERQVRRDNPHATEATIRGLVTFRLELLAEAFFKSVGRVESERPF